MAIPSQPQNPAAEQADGNILITWSAVLDATGYTIQRSTDGVNFTTHASVGQVASYLDSLPGTGIMYYYQVAATNGSGSGTYSSVVQMVAAPPSEMSLYELRLRSQQTADRVASQFVQTTEWNAFIRLAMYELYDIIITAYEDYFSGENVYINTNGSLQQYPIPNGASNYLGGTYPDTSGSTVPAKAFYKLVGVDLGVNTSNNAWVTLKRYDFIMRNAYVYPNSTSTIYGVYNLRYRLMGSAIDLIPTPAGNQQLRLRYAPRLTGLLQDTDVTDISYSGWIRYVIVRSAKYALDKEESDTNKLDAELLFLKKRIEEAASNRDIGIADTISETRQDGIYGGTGWGNGGGQGGWALAFFGLLPCLFQQDIGNGLLVDAIDSCQLLLGVLTACICLANLVNFRPGKFRNWASFAVKAGRRIASAFRNHVSDIVSRCSKEKMARTDTGRIVTMMANAQPFGDFSEMDHP